LNPHAGPAITLALILFTVTFGYVSACVVWPFTTCSRCQGTGKKPALFGGRAFRMCRRCHATGRRLRTGRKVWNFFHRLHTDAHR
jgi:DnaJ-class molecular chaperone